MNSSYAAETEEDWKTWCPDEVPSAGGDSPWFPGGPFADLTYFDRPARTLSDSWLCGTQADPIHLSAKAHFHTDSSNLLDPWTVSFEPATFDYFGLYRQNSSASSTNTGSTPYSSDDIFASQVPYYTNDRSSYSLAAAEPSWQSLQHHILEPTTIPVTTDGDLEHGPTLERLSLVGFVCADGGQKISDTIDPPMDPDADGRRPQRQCPRFAGDEYTPGWIRGDGVHRAGWCKLCENWHKLKDSAYWYHMHYSHGISCATGKAFPKPEGWRSSQGVAAREALCGGCKQWIFVGRFERGQTAYFRHVYKCQGREKSLSPRRPSKAASPGRVQKSRGQYRDRECL